MSWFHYDWELRGAPAAIDVDLAYEEEQPAAKATLLWLFCAAPEGKALAGGLLRRAEGMLKKAEKALPGAVHVGRIALENEIQYYFHTSREELLDELDALCEKEKKLALTCGREHDPGWNTYRSRLCPDAAAWQTVENEKTVELLRRSGDGLTAARRLRIYVFFPTESCRLFFQEQARLDGFAVGEPVYRPEQDLAYGAVLHCISTLEKRTLDALTTRIVRSAEKHDGALMGWDCPVVPKKHPLG